MARRFASVPLLAVLGVLALTGGTAGAQTPVDCSAGSCTFGHDDALDGTPGEIVSGFFDGGAQTGQPTAERTPGTYEHFDVAVPPGTWGSFSTTITWQDARLDFDLYVYRKRPNGTYEPAPVRTSAAFGKNTETITYFPPISGQPLPTGQVFGVFVDNWCTSDADPGGPCPIGADSAADDPADEDDFIGSVAFAPFDPDNALPAVTLGGPDRGAVNQRLTFTATASDADGIAGYAFDLDGDGRFETDALGSASASRRFDVPGTYDVGVRVTDRRGGTSFASRAVTITGAPLDDLGRPLVRTLPSKRLISSLKLGRPGFGGRRQRDLVVRYRVRERARVTLTLKRGGRTVRRLVRGRTREAGRTYRLELRSRKLRRGLYTLRMTVRTADGRRQTTSVQARRL